MKFIKKITTDIIKAMALGVVVGLVGWGVGEIIVQLSFLVALGG